MNILGFNALVFGDRFTIQVWVNPSKNLDSTFRSLLQKKAKDNTRLIELSSNNQAYKFTLKWPETNDYSIQTDDGTVTAE